MKLLNFLSRRSTGNVLALLVIAAFFILGLIRLYPHENNLQYTLEYSLGDDWNRYAKYGIDIVRNGILMPHVKGSYFSPSGFFYCYFLGLLFFIFGENDVPVFIIQHLMLGLSVALMFWIFRDKMRSLTAILFLGVLSVFTLLDVYKYYAVRLLNENLAFFTIPLFFFFFIKGFKKNNTYLQLIAAFLMGTIILTKPSIVLFGFVLILIVMPYYLKKGRKGIAYLLLFIAVLALSTSLLAVRNYLVCGKTDPLPGFCLKPVNHLRAWYGIPESVDLSGIDTKPIYTKLHLDSNIRAYLEYIRQDPVSFFGYYVKKTLFCFGFLPLLDEAFRLRPHWMLMWIGYFAYIFICKRARQKMEMWEITVHLFLLCFYIPLIIFAPIHNYGFRMLIPAPSFVLIFSFLALDRFISPATG